MVQIRHKNSCQWQLFNKIIWVKCARWLFTLVAQWIAMMHLNLLIFGILTLTLKSEKVFYYRECLVNFRYNLKIKYQPPFGQRRLCVHCIFRIHAMWQVCRYFSFRIYWKKRTCMKTKSLHCFRFASIRETQQGKQEERLPFFSLVFPPWLQNKYPNFVQNVLINQNRLVTPFDIHATFMTLLYPEDVPNEGDLSSRSISLFSRIPQEVSSQWIHLTI